mmetsp:Transcript_2868/g.7245  ORF Transcript_2868/g.7245 Transcript_2868/m.7245 type:complete len:218 (+) Transcript_2868:78-731(+)
MTSLGDVFTNLVGTVVLLGSLLTKMPQVTRILYAGNVLGLSEASVLMEALGYCCFSYYNIMQGYPFISWGEGAIMTFQTIALLMMFWIFDDTIDLRNRFSGVAAFAVIGARLLLRPVPPALIQLIGTLPTIMFIAAKSPQVLLNFRQGHTGQLAPLTYLLQLTGNTLRIITAIQANGGDPVVLCGHGSSAALNLIILAQVVKYRRATEALTKQKLPP